MRAASLKPMMLQNTSFSEKFDTTVCSTTYTTGWDNEQIITNVKKYRRDRLKSCAVDP
jgi:hypothetical protein